MKIERPRPTILKVTLHAYEWAALVAAARWALAMGDDALPQEAQDQLEQVLSRYEEERHRLGAAE